MEKIAERQLAAIRVPAAIFLGCGVDDDRLFVSFLGINCLVRFESMVINA